jgi:hypothetical protein
MHCLLLRWLTGLCGRPTTSSVFDLLHRDRAQLPVYACMISGGWDDGALASCAGYSFSAFMPSDQVFYCTPALGCRVIHCMDLPVALRVGPEAAQLTNEGTALGARLAMAVMHLISTHWDRGGTYRSRSSA